MKSEVFQWNESYSVGLKKVDEQHKEFLRIINELGDCIANKQFNKIRNEVYFSLLDFAHRYLLDEKILSNSVAEIDYSYFKEKHKEFMEKLEAFQVDCEKKCTELLFINLFNYLKYTYPDYISHYTPTLVKKLKECGVS